jgi:hypothetical protein
MEKPQLTEQAYLFLSETKKWTKFLSIIGFIFIGIFVLFALFFGVFFGGLSDITGSSMFFPSVFIILIYLLIAILYFFPVWFLFRFSTNLGKSLKSGNESELTDAFSYLKLHYKFIGILTIIFLSIYLLFIIFGVLIAGITTL